MEINIGDKFIFNTTDEITPFEGQEVTVTDMDIVASLMAGEPVYIIEFESVFVDGHEYRDSTALVAELTQVEAPALV